MPASEVNEGKAVVSRYFKYKSSQSLRDDARRLGLENDLSPLRTALRVSGRTVGNRLAIQPMEGCDGNLDGTPGELTLRRYRRFGAGGAKLIWGEACAVVPEGRANPRQLLIAAGRADETRQIWRPVREPQPVDLRACGTHQGRQSRQAYRNSPERP